MDRMIRLQVFLVLLGLTSIYCYYRSNSIQKTRLYMEGCPYAPKCTGQYLGKGCDGSGKLQGGIATLPMLDWWPIKVYRPCPAYLEAGYIYRRQGQTLDEVLFSEPSSRMKEKLALDAKKRAEVTELESIVDRSQSIGDNGSSNSSSDNNTDNNSNSSIDSDNKSLEEDSSLSSAEKFLNERFGKKS